MTARRRARVALRHVDDVESFDGWAEDERAALRLFEDRAWSVVNRARRTAFSRMTEDIKAGKSRDEATKRYDATVLKKHKEAKAKIAEARAAHEAAKGLRAEVILGLREARANAPALLWLPRDAISNGLEATRCHRCGDALPANRDLAVSDDGGWSVWCQALIAADGRARLRAAALCGGCSRLLRDWLAP